MRTFALFTNKKDLSVAVFRCLGERAAICSLKDMFQRPSKRRTTTTNLNTSDLISHLIGRQGDITIT